MHESDKTLVFIVKVGQINVACRRVEGRVAQKFKNVLGFDSPGADADLSRNDAGDPSKSAAAPDDVEAILLVAHSVMEKRPKRSGRGPEKHDEGPILLGRRGQWILSPNTNLSRPRIPRPPPSSAKRGNLAE